MRKWALWFLAALMVAGCKTVKKVDRTNRLHGSFTSQYASEDLRPSGGNPANGPAHRNVLNARYGDFSAGIWQDTNLTTGKVTDVYPSVGYSPPYSVELGHLTVDQVIAGYLAQNFLEKGITNHLATVTAKGRAGPLNYKLKAWQLLPGGDTESGGRVRATVSKNFPLTDKDANWGVTITPSLAHCLCYGPDFYGVEGPAHTTGDLGLKVQKDPFYFGINGGHQIGHHPRVEDTSYVNLSVGCKF